MIKGISKQIIEVQDTQSQYYEKAYFVVRPEFSAMEQALLERSAVAVSENAHQTGGDRRGGDGVPDSRRRSGVWICFRMVRLTESRFRAVFSIFFRIRTGFSDHLPNRAKFCSNFLQNILHSSPLYDIMSPRQAKP